MVVMGVKKKKKIKKNNSILSIQTQRRAEKCDYMITKVFIGLT